MTYTLKKIKLNLQWWNIIDLSMCRDDEEDHCRTVAAPSVDWSNSSGKMSANLRGLVVCRWAPAGGGSFGPDWSLPLLTVQPDRPLSLPTLSPL